MSDFTQNRYFGSFADHCQALADGQPPEVILAQINGLIEVMTPEERQSAAEWLWSAHLDVPPFERVFTLLSAPRATIEARNLGRPADMSSLAPAGFALTIAEVYDVRGRGRLACGTIASGHIAPGVVVDVTSCDGQVTRAMVRGIESFRGLRPTGAGDKIGLILDAAGQAVVEVGGRIATPAR